MRETSDQLSSIFSNATRLQIMQLLDEEPLTITGLAGKIPGTSASVISRHLSTLDDYGLIVKTTATGREYQLSPFGESLYCMMKPLAFFLKHGSYFESHSLASLPAHFLCDINALEGARFVKGTGSVWTEIVSYVNSIKQQSFFMVNTHLPYPYHEYEELRVIYTVKLFEELGGSKILAEIERNTNLAFENVELRLLPEIPLSIAIADDGEKGLLACPRNDGPVIDYAGMFIIEDETGMEFLKRLWEYYWDAAEPVALE